MSHAGTNIRKIRALKGISQAKLAKQLNINRASIGSYEEGRAEPKLETLLKIANLFSITVEQLVEAELKMNDLIGFKLEGEAPASQGSSSTAQKIPLFYPHEILILKEQHISGFSNHISLPLPRGVQRASFSSSDYSMHTKTNGPVPGDLLICEYCETPVIGVPMVVAHSKKWNFGRLKEISKKKATLQFDNRNYPPIEIDLSGTHSFWVLKGVYSSSLLF